MSRTIVNPLDLFYKVKIREEWDLVEKSHTVTIERRVLFVTINKTVDKLNKDLEKDSDSKGGKR